MMDFDCLDSKKVLRWDYIQAIGDLPEARRCHSLNAVGNLRLVLFAGDGHGGVRLKNDTYVFHIHEKRWEKLNIKGHQLPLPRWYHSATSLIPTWSDEIPLYGSHILIFGGRSAFSYLNDLFLLDIDNQTWTRVVAKGEPPAPRWCHTMTLLPGNRILLYGGSYEMGRSRQKYGFDELHVLHLDKMEWKKHPIQVAVKTDRPLHLQRESHTTCFSNNKIFISFGCSMNDEPIATVLVMDPDTLQIMRVIDTSQLIPPLATRQGSSATPLFQTNVTLTQTVNRIVFYGGENDSKERKPLSEIIILETETERWYRSSEDFTVLPPSVDHITSTNNNNNEPPTIHLARAYQAAEGIGSKVYVFGGQAESYEDLLSDLLVLETELCPPTLVDQCIKFIAKDSRFTINDLQALPSELTERIIQQITIMENNKNHLKLKNADQGSLENASIASLTETVDISEMSAQNEENEDESDSIFFSSIYDNMLSTLSDKNLDEDTLQFHIQQIIALLGLESTIQQMNVPPNKLKDTLLRILLYAKMQLQLEPLDNHPEEEDDEDTSDNMSTVAVASHASERNPTTANADDNVSVITDDMSLNSMNLQEEEDSDSQAS